MRRRSHVTPLLICFAATPPVITPASMSRDPSTHTGSDSRHGVLPLQIGIQTPISCCVWIVDSKSSRLAASR